MTTSHLRIASVNVPTDAVIRRVLLDEIRAQYRSGGMKAFAAANELPYDRVRDHLKGESDMTLKALLDYLGFLGLTLNDVSRRAAALD